MLNINDKDNYGATALIEASKKGHKGVIKLLLEKGADVNKDKDSYVFTALMYASQNGHKKIVDILRKQLIE